MTDLLGDFAGLLTLSVCILCAKTAGALLFLHGWKRSLSLLLFPDVVVGEDGAAKRCEDVL